MNQIRTTILMSLGDPELRADEVAARVGISQRYLSHVLRSHDTSFSDVLWSNRLPAARERLISPASSRRLINEIAFMSGFKSAAHFCRMFKAAYGATPSAYRAAHRGG